MSEGVSDRVPRTALEWGYPRKSPGLRVTIANYYRNMSIAPQDDIPNHFPRELAEDCKDPKLFKRMAGFGNPYQSQVLLVPRVVR